MDTSETGVSRGAEDAFFSGGRDGTFFSEERQSLFEVEAKLELDRAHITIARLCHAEPATNRFYREHVYWLDLCLTPRRPNAAACFVDHWSRARVVQIGATAAFPPREMLELHSQGGPHASLICQLRADLVERWLPSDFSWTERRLEAVLNIASDQIRILMLRLNHELRNPGIGHRDLCELIVEQLAVELARYIVAASGFDAKGGLASWRLRVVDERIADQDRPFPSVAELAGLCRLSTRQFSRAFRASRGCSISDFLAQSCMEAAKRRLYTAEPLAEIARGLGFATQSSFTAAFRRSTGSTPSAFRNRLGVR